jgi:hypothetical protein
VVLRPAFSQDDSQGRAQGSEELRSNGRRFNRVAASPRQFAHPAAYACRASGSSGTSRTSVSTTSVTATGRSITSTATVSTTGATGCLIRRAAFFTGVRLGLALAAVRFVAFAAFALRALPRIAVFALRSFARFCTFDFFLRLAMITPLVLRNNTMVQVAASYRTRVINRSQLERDQDETPWNKGAPNLVSLGV